MTIPTTIPIHRKPLTRLELKDKAELEGVTIRNHEHKVGQSADDTAAMLEGYEQLELLASKL